MNKKIILAILVLSLTTIFCTLLPGGQVSPTQDVNAMVNATLTALADIAPTLVPTVPLVPTLPPAPATGGISGHLSYPSDFIPPLRVVAFDAADPLNYSYVDTLRDQSDYTISGLPAGASPRCLRAATGPSSLRCGSAGRRYGPGRPRGGPRPAPVRRRGAHPSRSRRSGPRVRASAHYHGRGAACRARSRRGIR